MSSPRQSIVVPLDGSRAAENALPIAISLATVYDADLDLVYVIGSEGADPVAASDVFDLYGEELTRDYALDSQRCAFRVLVGNPAEEILQARGAATVIVMSSHGRGGFRATLIGSVTDKVVRGARVPVVVVPGVGGPPRPIKQILVGLDGSNTAERGLRAARDVASPLQAHVTLLRAHLPVDLGFRERIVYPASLPEAVEKDVTDYLKRLVLPGERMTAPLSDPATAILDEAAALDADLVVLTATGKGLAGRLFLGSTTDRVLHSLHRPLLILPREE